MRDLEERLLHEGDFSYEDITGQDEPPVDSRPAPRENTATGPGGEQQMDVVPKREDELEEKPDPSALNSQRAHRSTQNLMQHHKRQREIMMTRAEESMSLFHQSPQLLKTKSQH